LNRVSSALLVLEPIFEADLPPEIYAYRRISSPNSSDGKALRLQLRQVG
jgi:hypothetical protein